MHYNNIALAVATLSSTVAAQTVSKCDPTRGDICPLNPAFGKCNKPHSFDFTTVSSTWHEDEAFNSWWLPDDGVAFNKKLLSIDKEKGAQLTIMEKEQAPLIKTKRYIFYGRIDVTLQTAPGQGVVTSVVLEGDTRDEIDWEWIGGETTNVQTNFFSKGVNEFTQGKTHGVNFVTTEGMHTYSIDWTPEKIDFLVDGSVIRTTDPSQADNGRKWPQNPAQLKLGTWIGGKDTMPEGTVTWAGGLADLSKLPFIGYYQKVTITDYCGNKSSAKEYTYSDSSGTQDSIKVVDGEPAPLADTKTNKGSGYTTDIPSFSDNNKDNKDNKDKKISTTLVSTTTYGGDKAISTGTGASFPAGTGSSGSGYDSGSGSGSASSSGSSYGSKSTTTTSSSASTTATSVTAGAASMGISYAVAGLALLGFLVL
ncbi:putative glycosidase crf1 [Ceratocystis fimbriata CBS 114723]|uniref:Putative glycosidase crf1 n=1 Tax=Ceratocystis fimbriata CBS 114723 TaxID=1035309 RepID=A0A2C5X8E6_9PEZI|nr:putative glycosidase crf1 [Ceratocystis fimbriata CBS 114723]